MVGGSDEDEAAGGDHRPAVVLGPRVPEPLGGQFGKFSQGNLPGEFAPVQIDGRQRAPRGLDARISVRVQQLVVAGVPVTEDRVPGFPSLSAQRSVLALQEIAGHGLEFVLFQLMKSRHPATALTDHADDLRLGRAIPQVKERREFGWSPPEVRPVTPGAPVQVQLPSTVRLIGPGPLHQAQDPRHFVGIDVEQSGLGIEGGSSPIRSAVEPGEDHRPLETGRGEGSFVAQAPQPLENGLVRRRSAAGDHLLRQPLPRKRRRLQGEWLGGGDLFPYDVGFRRRPVLDGEQGRSPLPVEDEDVTRLRGLGHGVHQPAVPLHRDQRGLSRNVPIPEIVADKLKMPDALPGRGPEGNQGIGKEIIAVAVGSIEVEGGRSRGDEDQSPPVVHAHARPTVGGSGVFPGLLRPGLVARLSRMGNRVK